MQKRSGNLLGGQVADLAQGQRHLGVGGQRRVAAGEDQPQTVVAEQFFVAGVLRLAFQQHDHVRL
ncbi:hypothetical protein D3C79_1044150 [compost metagenome]